MLQFTVKMHVGPCGVHEIADRLEREGLSHVREGTEHVYWIHYGVSPHWVQIDVEYIINQLFPNAGFKPYVRLDPGQLDR